MHIHKKWLLPLVLFIISLSISVNKMISVKNPVESCNSKSILIHGALRFYGHYTFSFLRESGVANVNGLVIINDQKYQINRRVFFTYTRDGKKLLLTTKSVDTLTGTDFKLSGIGGHLSSFFKQPGGELFLTLKYGNNGTHVFFEDDVPMFYCQ